MSNHKDKDTDSAKARQARHLAREARSFQVKIEQNKEDQVESSTSSTSSRADRINTNVNPLSPSLLLSNKNKVIPRNDLNMDINTQEDGYHGHGSLKNGPRPSFDINAALYKPFSRFLDSNVDARDDMHYSTAMDQDPNAFYYNDMPGMAGKAARKAAARQTASAPPRPSTNIDYSLQYDRLPSYDKAMIWHHYQESMKQRAAGIKHYKMQTPVPNPVVGNHQNKDEVSSQSNKSPKRIRRRHRKRSGDDPSSSSSSSSEDEGKRGNGNHPSNGRGPSQTQPSNRVERAPQLPGPLQFGKSGITPFNGKHNRLNPFLRDIDMLCNAHNIPKEDQLRALAIYQHCVEDVKTVLRNMSDTDLLDPIKIVNMLKQSFGVRSLIKVSKDFKDLITLIQPKGPSLHQHWVRFKTLVMSIVREEPKFNLAEMGDGKLLQVLFIMTLTNDQVHNMLTMEDYPTWLEFEQKVINLAQMESGKKAVQGYQGHNNYAGQTPYAPPPRRPGQDKNMFSKTNLRGGYVDEKGNLVKPKWQKKKDEGKKETKYSKPRPTTADKAKKPSGPPFKKSGNGKPAYSKDKHKKHHALQAIEELSNSEEDGSDAEASSKSSSAEESNDGYAMPAVMAPPQEEKTQLVANRNEKFSVMDQCVIILDTGAYPSSCSQLYLDRHGVLYIIIAVHNPPKKIRTAKGIVKAYKTVRLPFAFGHSVFHLDVLVLDTPALVPILYGSNSFKKAKATLNYKGTMEMKANGKTIIWSYSPNSGLYYINLHQKEHMLQDVPLNHAMTTTADHQAHLCALDSITEMDQETASDSSSNVDSNEFHSFVCIMEPEDTASSDSDRMPDLESDSDSDCPSGFAYNQTIQEHKTKKQTPKRASARLATGPVPMYKGDQYLDELAFERVLVPRKKNVRKGKKKRPSSTSTKEAT